MNPLDGLNARQIQFCEQYIMNGGNGTRAVLDAGYKMTENAAGVHAAKLLKNAKITAYIQGHLDKQKQRTTELHKFDLNKATDLLVKIAFDGMEELVQVSEGGHLEIKPDANLGLLDGVSYSRSESHGKDGYSKAKSFSFKRSDRLKALDMLIKLSGGYDESKDGAGGESKKLAPGRVLAALAKLTK